MGKRGGSSFLLVVALLAGIALGYCFAPGAADEPAPKEEKCKPAKHRLADAGESASVKALRSRIADLERRLAAAQAKAAATTNEVAVAPQGGPMPPRGNPREWMDNLKKNDPERYAQMTNRFAQFRRRRLERQQRNLDFLASVDTSHMSASAKKTHAALQGAMARREELDEKMHQEGLSDEEREALFGQIMATDHELRGLRRAERVNLFEATANALGFEGEDAKEIVGTLKEVVESTENSWRHMGPPPGGGRPGGPQR